MTTANSPDPPRLATWLLEKFSPVLKNTPLEGDLIEAFKLGRSASWYWRQVFGAILIALPNLLWKQTGRVVYAVSCTGFTSAAWFFMFPSHRSRRGSVLPLLFALFQKGLGIPWPWSLIYEIAFLIVFQTVIIAVALGAYLAFSRIWKLQNLLRAWMVVVVVLACGNAVLTFLSVILLPGPVGWEFVFSVPTMVALLLGMWTANRGGMSRPI